MADMSPIPSQASDSNEPAKPFEMLDFFWEACSDLEPAELKWLSSASRSARTSLHFLSKTLDGLGDLTRSDAMGPDDSNRFSNGIDLAHLLFLTADSIRTASGLHQIAEDATRMLHAQAKESYRPCK